MAETRDLTVAMSSDTGGFSEGIQQAKNILLELNRTLLDNQSTLKEATKELNNYEKEQRNLQAEMSRSGGDTEENRAKMAQLTVQIQEQREKVASLRTEQTALRGQISRATAALREQTEAARNQAQASDESVSATDRLKNTISEQQTKLESLKEEYSNTVLEQGKTSEQAQSLAGQIAELSAEIENNRQTLENAAYSASDYNDALNDTTEATENQNKANDEASDGFTVLKGAIADLAADALQAAIDKFGELMTSGKQALNSIQAQTGMTADEMAAMKDQMYDLYGNNFGDSLEDVANVLADVKENINETNPEKIKDIAQNAIALRDTFGTDVSETLRGVNALMTSMGLTAEQAFDYIAKGSQNGLNKTEELSDNLAEYVQIWSQAGFSAKEMFSVLQNGLDSGAFNLDKVNDLVKEISVSIVDGRLESSLDSFSSKTEQVFQAFKNGEATQKDVFDSIISDLSTTSGLAEKLATASDTWSALGEDNAMAVIEALNNVNDTYSDVEGTMQSINDIKYDDVGNQLATLGRKFEVDLIQPIVEGVTPALESILTWATDNLPLVASAFTSVTTAVLGYKAALGFETVLATLKNSFAGLTASTKQSAVASAEDATAKTVEAGATQTAKVAQDGLNTSMKANPILLVVSAIASLIVGIGTYIATAQQATSETDKFKESLDSVKKSAEESIAHTNAEVEIIKELGAQYEELRTKTNRTANEQKTLDNIAKELAKSLGISTDKIKNQNGEYISLNDTIDETIKKMKQEAEINAKKSILQSAYESKEKANNELSNALKEYNDFIAENKDFYERYQKGKTTIWEQGKVDELTSYTAKINEWQSAIEDCDTAINQASDSLKESLQAKNDDAKTTSSGAAANRDYAESMNDVSDSADNSAESIEDLKAKLESQNTALEENQKAIDETQKKLEYYNQTKQEAIKNGGDKKDENGEYENEKLRIAIDYINRYTAKLSGLQAQQKIIKDNISDTEKAVESLEGSVDDALDNMIDSCEQWQSVLEEVNAETNKNGTISLKTLNSIQKKYPELTDLVNEYINGLKDEKDVINGLKSVYDNDVDNYNNSLKIKAANSEEFFKTYISNNESVVKKFKEHYDADIRNFATLAQAKASIEEKLYKEMMRKREVYNRYAESQIYTVGMQDGKMYLTTKGGTRQVSAEELAAFEKAQKEYQQAFTDYLGRDRIAEQEINKILDEFINVSPLNLSKFNISNNSSNKSNSSNNSKKWTTSNGDGVVGTGDTRAASHLDWIDKEKNLGRLSLESEIRELEKIKKYRENTADDLYEINLRLYKANQELQEQATKKAEEAANKRKEQYALANEAYKKLADDRITAIKKVTEAAEKSAEKEIAAIDRQIEARKRLNEDKSIKAEIDAINARLNYEQLDSLSRHELERKKQELLNEQAETEWQRKMSDKKDSIQSNLSAIQEKNNSIISAYQTAATNFSNYIARLSGTQTNSQIVNNKTTSQNIQIIQNALSNDQIVRKLMNALYD